MSNAHDPEWKPLNRQAAAIEKRPLLDAFAAVQLKPLLRTCSCIGKTDAPTEQDGNARCPFANVQK
jgi:hypothetical protein